MQAQPSIETAHGSFTGADPEVSELRETRALLESAETPCAETEQPDPEVVVAKAGADLPQDADADLLLHAIQKREQRSFALKFTGILGGLALAAYLAGSGNGAIVQGVIHLAVGAAGGAAGALVWRRRARA